VDCCEDYSDIYISADDAKFFKHILHASDSCLLQHAITELQNWSEKWMLCLNIQKCKIVSFGNNVDNMIIS